MAVSISVPAGNLTLVGKGLRVRQYETRPQFLPADPTPMSTPGDVHLPCGHWHEGQSDDPVWDFTPQEELPHPYHEHETKPEICGHWHRQEPSISGCIYYVDETSWNGVSGKEEFRAPGNRFIFLNLADSANYGNRFYGTYGTSGASIFRFSPVSKMREEETAFATGEMRHIKQMIFYDDHLYCLCLRDGYSGYWIQKVSIPAIDSSGNFALVGDPLYCGSVVTGTDGKVYGNFAYCLNQQTSFWQDYWKPITGAGYAAAWEELPGGYSYQIDTYTDYASRATKVTNGGTIVSFDIIDGVGFVLTSGQYSGFTSQIAGTFRIAFDGTHQAFYPVTQLILVWQLMRDPLDPTTAAVLRARSIGGNPKLDVMDLSGSSVSTYDVTGMVDENGDSYDGFYYHSRSIWHSNGRIYNLHGVYNLFDGRIVAISPSDGSIIAQYFWKHEDYGFSANKSDFIILGDFVYVWSGVADSGYSSVVTKLTLDLEFVCEYLCPGFPNSFFQETGGDLASDGNLIYNFNDWHTDSKVGITWYEPEPSSGGSGYPHDPVWPFHKYPYDKF